MLSVLLTTILSIASLHENTTSPSVHHSSVHHSSVHHSSMHHSSMHHSSMHHSGGIPAVETTQREVFAETLRAATTVRITSARFVFDDGDETAVDLCRIAGCSCQGAPTSCNYHDGEKFVAGKCGENGATCSIFWRECECGPIPPVPVIP